MPTASPVGKKQAPKKQKILFKLGTVPKSDKFGYKLHNAVINGNVRAARKVIKKGIPVDYSNDQHQTPLFIACYSGKERIVELLLKYGADPNYRCDEKLYTPVHGACASGNPKILCRLIEAGGDLRLHDKHGFAPNDWCTMIQNPKKSQQILEYIETARMYAMTKSGQDLLLENKNSVYDKLSTIKDDKNGKGLIKRTSHSQPLSTRESSIHSLGFGKVYMPSLSHAGSLAYVPYIAEVALKPDLQSISYQTTRLFAMESFKWGFNKVTIKKLTSDVPDEKPFIDLLINEKDFLCQLRHPSLLLLMGICNTDNLDSMWLVFERADLGTLFYQLHHHEICRAMSIGTGCELLFQICEALIYLHSMGYFHCNISSHSIHLTHTSIAKLGNLEFMVERDFDSGNQKRSKVRHLISPMSTYNWMAPELMAGEPPSVESDIYSFSTVLWEIFTGDVPWGETLPLTIKRKLLKENKVLYAMDDENKVLPKPYNEVLQSNLAVSPEERVFNLEQIAMILKGASLKLAKQERPISIDNRLSREHFNEKKISEPSSDVERSAKSHSGYVAACVNRIQNVVNYAFRRRREQSENEKKTVECKKSESISNSQTPSESQESLNSEPTPVDTIEIDKESAVNDTTNCHQPETVASTAVPSSLDSQTSTATIYENDSNASIWDRPSCENSVEESLETNLSSQWFAGKGSVKNLVSSFEVQTEATVDKSQPGTSKSLQALSKKTVSRKTSTPITTSVSSSIEGLSTQAMGNQALSEEDHLNNHIASTVTSKQSITEAVKTSTDKDKLQSETVSSDRQYDDTEMTLSLPVCDSPEVVVLQNQCDDEKTATTLQQSNATELSSSEKPCDSNVIVTSNQPPNEAIAVQEECDGNAVPSEQQDDGMDAVESQQHLKGTEEVLSEINEVVSEQKENDGDENDAVPSEKQDCSTKAESESE